MKRTTNILVMLLCISFLKVKAQNDIPTDFNLKLSYTEAVTETWLVEDYSQMTKIDMGSTRLKTQTRKVDHYENRDFERTTILTHLESNKDDWQTRPTQTVMSNKGVKVYTAKGEQKILNNDLFDDKYKMIKKNKQSFIGKLIFPELDMDVISKLGDRVELLDGGQIVKFNFSEDNYYLVDMKRKSTTIHEVNAQGVKTIRTQNFIPVYPNCEVDEPIWLPGQITELTDVILPSGLCAKKKRFVHRYDYSMTGGFICERRKETVNQVTTSLFKIAPNPATDLISISSNEALKDNKVVVKLMDLNGRLILEHSFKSGNRKLGLQNVPAGVYLVDISSGNIKQVEKLIINN